MTSYQDEDGLAPYRRPNVRATKFRRLNINDSNDIQWSCHHNNEINKEVMTHIGYTKKNKLINHKEALPPAVLFDQVCFKVLASQQSSQQHSNPIARILQQVIPTCNSTDQNIQILKSIQLKVPQGCIFGLLGPSSCGKTTLLRCLVGLLKPCSGSIYLMGRPINNGKSRGGSGGTKSASGEPSFGYMPQDLGLYEDFTIRQLLTMFGQYTGMADDLIETRLQFMAKFLELPEVDREICTLSGGQKRRVSFAIACIHMPPLIILDEPTVGVDPILRQSIWRYLRDLARDQGKTIIITTHYIEEAAQADQVALMRAGEILIQDSPKTIMDEYNCDTLEEAFLQICSNVAPRKQNAPSSPELPVRKEQHQPKPLANHEEIKVANIHHKTDDNLDYCRPEADANGAVHVNKHDKKKRFFTMNKSNKLTITTSDSGASKKLNDHAMFAKYDNQIHDNSRPDKHPVDAWAGDAPRGKDFKQKIRDKYTLLYALFYKNYRRNMNSIPLIAFQFMLPIIQMISFSLCVGGRPSHVGLGLVNHDSLEQLASFKLNNISSYNGSSSVPASIEIGGEDYVTIGDNLPQELLSKRYLDFVDPSVLDIREYPNLELALRDVRQAKLWAAIEFGENFTSTLITRFDPDNFYTLERETVAQSVVRLYPDKSNKILDMICMRILVNSFREFLAHQFEHLRQLPIQVKEIIFDIKPNLISNSLDGYTESIAAGLLASLTYIMAAGLTTFIMVVERGQGILERTYTSGVNPVLYLLAHALFRSLVMMVQIGLVVFLTFYILRQPLVGSLALAYLMLMSLNFTGISYGLLVSSLVADQNGAALTIVSSLVVKITMSGILWPLEAIPVWLRTACLAQPLTFPIQALKQITLKGATIEHRSVQLGFLVSFCWTCLFLIIAARRFKFYQH